MFRYGVYIWLLLIVGWHAWQALTPVCIALPLVLIIPAILHVGFGMSPRWVYWAHVTELVIVPGLLVWSDTPTEAVLFFAYVGLVCNAAMWGIASVPLACSCGLFVAVLFAQVGGLSIVALSGMALFSGLLGGLAHGQTWLQISGKDRMREKALALRRYLPEGFDPEVTHVRQWLTIAFIDLGGFTRAVNLLSPELMREVLNDFLGEVTKKLSAGGGSVNKFVGDGVLCAFAPTAPEQRSATAVSAVLIVKELFSWIDGFNTCWQQRGCTVRFSLTAGIASGYCSVGQWGAGDRLDYTVIGVPVNLAYRLQEDTAGPMLIDAATAELIGDTVASSGETLKLKGLGQTLSYRLQTGLPLEAFTSTG
ncbi:MAG: adenylate/guanylate cyclase domain-containing protein [Pseudomonadota bacterium]|nr:adenylate/guanylate cyclase domain-containing protein [Pseudomonadota bacterium]